MQPCMNCNLPVPIGQATHYGECPKPVKLSVYDQNGNDTGTYVLLDITFIKNYVNGVVS